MSKIINASVERKEGRFVIFGLGLLGFGFLIPLEDRCLVFDISFPRILK